MNQDFQSGKPLTSGRGAVTNDVVSEIQRREARGEAMKTFTSPSLSAALP